MRLPAALVLWFLLAAPVLAEDLGGAVALGDGATMDGLEELRAEQAALDQVDEKLESRLRRLRGLPRGGRLPPAARSWQREGRVRVLVRVRQLDDGVRAALAAAGLAIEREATAAGLVEGWLEAAALRAVAALPDVRSVRPAERGHTRAGGVTTDGDTALRANQVRTDLGFDGAGVRVGAISDGIDGIEMSRGSGDLPPEGDPRAVTVPPGCSAGSGAEGTAMLEIVHDLAPGASLLFASGIDSPLAFIEAVQCLTAAGADVIVDDLGFFGEPYFEDGPVAQAVRGAVQAGVSYHSAAGNAALVHYETGFRATPQSAFHDFDAGAGIDNTSGVLIPPGGSLLCVLQWDEPFGEADDDYDLLLLEGERMVVAASDNVQRGRGDPLEIVVWANGGGAPAFRSLVIERKRGAARTLELFCARDVQDMEHVTPGSSIFGHAAIPEAVAVAAIDVRDPGHDTVERFSSQGPATVAFPVPATHAKPDVAAVDGVSTSVPGFAPFFGTSAAVPHVAAVAALMLQKNPFLIPAEVQATLASTAVDIGPPGFDDAAGAGRVDTLQAVMAVSAPECFADAECDDANPCTADRCDRGRCVRAPASCDDGNPCNGLETCVPETGGCVPGAQAPDGTPCPDGTVCTGDETCRGGVCTPGTPLTCDDGDTCTENTCSPEAGCRFPALEGLESVSCVLDRGLPDCPGVELPRSIQRRFTRAQRLVDRGRTAQTRRAQRGLLNKAARALKRAVTLADRARRRERLPPECSASVAGSLGDARDRARAAARSLR